MLTPQQKAEAQKRLKLMSSQMQNDKKVKETIKNKIKIINDLILTVKDDPKAHKNLLLQISSKIAPKIVDLQRLSKGFDKAQQQMKADKQRMNKQRLYAIEDKQRFQLSIQQIKETIKKIQQTVKQSIQEQSKKRIKIQQDLEKSLGQIRQKITTFTKQTEEMDKQNQTLRLKKKQIEQKMSGLQVDFRKKAEQKDDEVRKQKEQLMVKLQLLEGQVSEVTQINKEFSAKQKANFDKKLSLYLKTKKFPEYSTSFENSAKTIDQCKQQLFKGVQRMNDAKEAIQKYEKESRQLSNTYLLQLKKKSEKEGRIEQVKKEKQGVRQRIITLQNKIKELKTTKAE